MTTHRTGPIDRIGIVGPSFSTGGRLYNRAYLPELERLFRQPGTIDANTLFKLDASECGQLALRDLLDVYKVPGFKITVYVPSGTAESSGRFASIKLNEAHASVEACAAEIGNGSSHLICAIPGIESMAGPVAAAAAHYTKWVDVPVKLAAYACSPKLEAALGPRYARAIEQAIAAETVSAKPAGRITRSSEPALKKRALEPSDNEDEDEEEEEESATTSDEEDEEDEEEEEDDDVQEADIPADVDGHDSGTESMAIACSEDGDRADPVVENVATIEDHADEELPNNLVLVRSAFPKKDRSFELYDTVAREAMPEQIVPANCGTSPGMLALITPFCSTVAGLNELPSSVWMHHMVNTVIALGKSRPSWSAILAVMAELTFFGRVTNACWFTPPATGARCNGCGKNTTDNCRSVVVKTPLTTRHVNLLRAVAVPIEPNTQVLICVSCISVFDRVMGLFETIGLARHHVRLKVKQRERVEALRELEATHMPWRIAVQWRGLEAYLDHVAVKERPRQRHAPYCEGGALASEGLG